MWCNYSVIKSPKYNKTLVNSVICTLQNTSSTQKMIIYPHASTYSSSFSEPNRSEKTMFFLLIQHVLVLSQTQKTESNKSFHIYWGSHEVMHAASVNRYLKAKLYMCNIKLSWNNLLKPLCKFMACKRTGDWIQGMLLIIMCKLISGLYHTLSQIVKKFFTDIYNNQLLKLKHINRHAHPKSICWTKIFPFLPFRVEHKLHGVDGYKSMCTLKSYSIGMGMNMPEIWLPKQTNASLQRSPKNAKSFIQPE